MYKAYIEKMIAGLQKLEEEKGSIDKAAGILADAILEDRLIHLCGVEPHTSFLSSEIFFKAGMPVQLNPIYDPALSFDHGAYRSSMCRSLENLMPNILSYYRNIQSGDPIILIGLAADSRMLLHAAEWSKKKGLRVIAIIVQEAEVQSPLAELAEVIISSHTGIRDRVVEVNGIACGGIQSACLGAVINLLMIETIGKVDFPMVWSGDSLADEKENQNIIKDYLCRIRHL